MESKLTTLGVGGIEQKKKELMGTDNSVVKWGVEVEDGIRKIYSSGRDTVKMNKKCKWHFNIIVWGPEIMTISGLGIFSIVYQWADNICLYIDNVYHYILRTCNGLWIHNTSNLNSGLLRFFFCISFSYFFFHDNKAFSKTKRIMKLKYLLIRYYLECVRTFVNFILK